MIAIVMGLIADLDSPRSGLLRVDLRSLERVEQDLRSLPSVSSAPNSDAVLFGASKSLPGKTSRPPGH
jgi:hypothetical protein